MIQITAIAGGFYLRFLPYWFIKHAIKNLSFREAFSVNAFLKGLKKALPKKYYTSYAMKKINKKGHPAIVYIHPWEFDLEQPRVNSLKQGHYYRLSTTERKFKKLLKDFEFTSVRRWLELL